MPSPTRGWRPSHGPRYLLRAAAAAAARGGRWGNHGYEAAYAMVYEDGDGEQLTGRHRYTLRFERTPPVGAFWSVTMYDTLLRMYEPDGTVFDGSFELPPISRRR